MARTLIATNELIVGENHPNLPDTKNRYGKELWAAWLVEHTPTGEHASPYNVFPIPMHGSVTGTGAAQTVTWPVDTLTEVLSLSLWTPNSADIYMVTGDSVPNVKSSASELPQTDRVTAMDTDGFTLGTAAEVNTAGVTCFYFALGLGTTTDAGVNNDPPDWIQHGTPLIGGDGTASGNSVEYDLDTKFQVEHSEEGVHDASAFSHIAKAEQGTFTPDGSTLQSVILDDSTLSIKSLILLPHNTNRISYKTSTMPNLRELSTTALSDVTYASLYTGRFEINGSILGTETTFIQMTTDKPDGSRDFADDAIPAHLIQILSDSGISYSNAAAHSGTTSIRQIAAATPVPSNIFVNPLSLAAPYIYTLVGKDFDFSCEYRLDSTTDVQNFGHYRGLSIEMYFQYSFTSLNHFNTAININLNSLYRPTVSLYVNDGTGGINTLIGTITGTTTVNDSTFHTIRINFSGGYVKLYIDGSLQGTPLAYVSNFGYFAGMFLGMAPCDDKPQYLDDIYVKYTPEYFQSGIDHDYFVVGT